MAPAGNEGIQATYNKQQKLFAITPFHPRTIIFLLLILLSPAGYSQGYFNNWYFGTNAGITFNNGAPVALTDGRTNHLEGTACISDASGQLLFYTDGVTVWNRNHTVLPNGTGLTGDWSSAQSALIVPMPGNANKYYIFTVNDWMSNGDLRYSVVDMTLNGGLGDIIPGQKNIFLSTAQTEKLVAANSTSCGVWVLTHQRNNNRFEARLVTTAGVGAPVFSDAGAVHYATPIPPDNYNALTGVMKVSKDNRKLAVATLSQINQVFDFNAATGQVSNPVNLPIPYPNQGYGICFSPDNTKIYATEGRPSNAGFDIFQFDLSSNDPLVIAASKTFVGRATAPYIIVGDLQIGPDNRIYIPRTETSFLAVIPSPNLPAPACGFINDGVFLAGRLSRAGLPNEIRKGGDGLVTPELGADTVLCPGSSLTLTAPAATAYLWSTGATTQSITLSNAGTYWLQVTNGPCIASDTIRVQVSSPVVGLGADTALCEGNTMVLNARKGFASYLWQDGSTDSLLTVTGAGTYYVTVTNNCGIVSSDTVIVHRRTETIYAGPDRSKCNTDTLHLTAPAGFLNYNWSNNYNINATNLPQVVVNPLVDTAYFLRAEKTPGCFAYDTVRITVFTSPPVNLGADTSFCSGTTLVLDAGAGFSSYLWSNNSTARQIQVGAAGTYYVSATTAQGCRSVDTMEVKAVWPLPNPVLNKNNELCTGDSRVLNPGNFASYLWQDGSTGATYTARDLGTYWVEVRDNRNCAARDTAVISRLLPLPNSFLPPDTAICAYGTMGLAALRSFNTYTWSTGSAGSSITIDKAGLYWLQVRDEKGCTGRDSILVHPKQCLTGVFIPTAFTPNRDNRNDVFKAVVLGPVKSFELVVFNRWGEVVFRTRDPKASWDGKFNGVEQKSDSFVWLCTYRFEGEHVQQQKGTVVLIR